MKRVYVLFLLMFLTIAAFSQAWLHNLPQNKSKDALTFFDYKNAFNSYWAPYNVVRGYYYVNGVKKKAVGWKQFKRWEYYMESQVNPTTGVFPNKSAQQVYEEYKSSSPQLKTSNSASWTSLGANSSDGGYAGVGRIACIAFHPTDNNTYWVGAASGGLWVTTNNGTNWSCLTDNNGALAVSDIVIPSDYATSNTIYIATGDRDGWDNNSIGVLKSTNGGSTWSATGLSYSLSNNNMVNRLLLNPTNNKSIIAATSGGVYKTLNGGTTWTTQLSTNDFIDMEFKPGDTTVIYGSTQNGTIFVSTNSGTSWTQAFSDANAQRIELAVSANQPTWVYALADQSDNGLYGIYKSTNSGASYTQVFAGTTKNLLGWYSDGSDAGGQGFYDLSLAVSPSNASILLVGGVNTHKSTTGGTAWTCSNCWVGSQPYNSGSYPVAHADKHCLKFRANGDLFETNDGGVYISTNSGTTWTDKTNGMVISQMYKLSNSQTVSTEVITGLQDNGTKLLSGGAWSDVKGGDGTECIIDYTNVNTQYGTYVQGQIDRTTDHWNTTTDISANIPGGAPTGAWVTPYIMDPVNHLTLYAGYADVYKTTNTGTSWTKISTMNTSNNIRSMAIAPSNTQVLYVADQTTIWKTINGGTSWTNITGTLPVGSANITYITVKNDDANTLWITMDGYNANRVYQSSNGGTSWTSLSTGLPQLPAYSIVQNKQSTTELQLYVGTELGIYFKKGTANWVAYNSGLPNVKIGEIEIYYDSNPQNSKLRAATYGRGLWESYVYYNACTPPTTQATTITSSAITLNSMTIGWTRGNGTKVLVVAHQGAAVNSDPVNGTAYTASTLFGSGTQLGTGNYVVYNGIGTSANITALTPGTAYYYAVYEYDSTLNCYLTPALTGNISTTACTAVAITTQPTSTQTACSPINNILFTVAATTGTTPITYQWQYNNGGTWANVANGVPTAAIYTNATTDSMTLNGITTTATYQYRCYLTNCSNGFNATSNIASLVVTTVPTTPGNITGTTPVCQGQSSVIYSITPITNATSYVWTLPTGATGSSTTYSINVSYGASALSGNITVKGNNSCGAGATSTLAVTVNPTPATPVITLTGNTLSSNATSGNQWYNLATGILNSATAQTYMPQQIGNYFVIVTINGCISDSSNVIHYDNTGIALNNIDGLNLKVIPNPFTDKTSFNYTLNESTYVRLSIYDMIGREINILNENKQDKGDHTIVMEAGNLRGGVYFYKMNIGNNTITGKIVLTK